MQLTKHHGLGNDFLVVLDVAQPDGPVEQSELPALARRLCARRTGIGADGLILGADPSGGDGGVDVVMHLHNADGSRAEVSGNGLRCLAQAVAAARPGAGPGVTRLLIGTDAGVRTAEVTAGATPGEVQVAVGMGLPAPGPALPDDALVLLGERPHRSVDTGNPHLVVFVDDLGAVSLRSEGPALERCFPGGCNIEFVTVDAPRELSMLVWERGAGETDACGTGACAAVAAARDRDALEERVTVHMPGGDAEVLAGDDGFVLRGPSVRIAAVDVPGG